MDVEIHERRPTPRARMRGELPILFHLRDVSRRRPDAAKPPVVAPEPSGASTLTAAAIPAEPAVVELPAFAPVAAAASEAPRWSESFIPFVPPAQATPSVEPVAEAASAAAESAAAAANAPSVASQEATVPLTFALGSPLHMAPTLADSQEPIASTAVEAPLASEPANSANPASTVSTVSTAPVVEARPTRRFKTPPTEKWFATHGKFIAACFVVALAGTVYMARNNRKSSPPDAAGPAGPLLAATETAASPSISIPSQEATATFATSKAVQSGKAEVSTVELLVPIAPHVAAADKPASGDSLFQVPANRKSEERVAARADLSSSAASLTAAATSAATNAATVPAATMPVAYPVANAPSSHQEPAAMAGYPQISYPQTNSPALPPMPPPGTPGQVSPAAAYQAVAPPYYPPTSQYPPTNQAPPASAWGPPVPPVPTSPGQTSEIIARGQRYERTGSGNYEGLR